MAGMAGLAPAMLTDFHLCYTTIRKDKQEGQSGMATKELTTDAQPIRRNSILLCQKASGLQFYYRATCTLPARDSPADQLLTRG
jgi:hypothetical protein